MKKLTDAEKYQQLKAQTEKAGIIVKEVDGKIVVTRKRGVGLHPPKENCALEWAALKREGWRGEEKKWRGMNEGECEDRARQASPKSSPTVLHLKNSFRK